MRKQLTDQVMLTAAKKRLAEHLETRPATKAEADEIRQSYLNSAERLEQAAVDVVYRPKTAAEIGRGKHAVAAQHAEGIMHSQSLTEAGRLRQQAGTERLRAAAWECEGDDMTDVWEQTRQELQGRVDYYQRLVDAK